MKANEENGKSLVMVNGRYQKVRRFSSNEFWENIGCLVSATNFDIVGSRMWEKGEGKKYKHKEQ